MKQELYFIGDVHGKIENYQKIINNLPKNVISFQLGDFGFKKEHDWFLENVDCDKHKIVFGNHDYLPYVNRKHSIGDSYYLKDYSFLAIRGAYSIDKQYRQIGIDCFLNEELCYTEMQLAIDCVIRDKPKLIISHDCPQTICKYLFGINESSITRNGFQVLFENYQPDIWVFGHHHLSKELYIKNTKFICLNELEVFCV